MISREMIIEISKKTGYSVLQVEDIASAVFQTIRTRVTYGRPVMVAGFGGFNIRFKPARKHPLHRLKPGLSGVLPAKHDVVFKIDGDFKKEFEANNKPIQKELWDTSLRTKTHKAYV